ncbi:MAG: hypothetical protein HQK65_21320, partial [Desulfamplus sp.]|nr:hypothetical protein [Desulfamplus sp.]
MSEDHNNTTRIYFVGEEASKEQIRNTLINFDKQLFEIEGESSPNQAFEKIKTIDHDVCMVDNLGSTKDYLDFVQDAIEVDCKVPLLLILSDEEEGLDHKLMEAGASACIYRNEITPFLLRRVIQYAQERFGNR